MECKMVRTLYSILGVALFAAFFLSSAPSARAAPYTASPLTQEQSIRLQSCATAAAFVLYSGEHSQNFDTESALTALKLSVYYQARLLKGTNAPPDIARHLKNLEERANYMAHNGMYAALVSRYYECRAADLDNAQQFVQLLQRRAGSSN
jgi:hypothetical protein